MYLSLVSHPPAFEGPHLPKACLPVLYLTRQCLFNSSPIWVNLTALFQPDSLMAKLGKPLFGDVHC